MRTIVYVDGYNLYYGRLSQTPYKWLDVVALLHAITMEHEPGSVVALTRYFTAPVLARYGRRGQASVEAQSCYLRALSHVHKERLTITHGKHLLTPEPLPRVVLDADGDPMPPHKDDRVDVWRIVEKKTDVNLALAMYRDACAKRCDQMVLCSNDSDAEPVLEAIRSDFASLRIGVIAPVAPGKPSSDGLGALAHWRRRAITDGQLEAAQLPPHVTPERKKTIFKPDYW